MVRRTIRWYLTNINVDEGTLKRNVILNNDPKLLRNEEGLNFKFSLRRHEVENAERKFKMKILIKIKSYQLKYCYIFLHKFTEKNYTSCLSIPPDYFTP